LRDAIEHKRRKFVQMDILRDLRSKRQTQSDAGVWKIARYSFVRCLRLW